MDHLQLYIELSKHRLLFSLPRVSAWGAYSGGVFDGCSYSNIPINHVVQLVGYGTDPAEGDYWLVRTITKSQYQYKSSQLSI